MEKHIGFEKLNSLLSKIELYNYAILEFGLTHRRLLVQLDTSESFGSDAYYIDCVGCIRLNTDVMNKTKKVYVEKIDIEGTEFIRLYDKNSFEVIVSDVCYSDVNPLNGVDLHKLGKELLQKDIEELKRKIKED